MIRKKGLIFLAVLAGIFFLISIFLTDNLLEIILEDVATDLNGAVVEIEDLDIALFDSKLNFKSLQVTDVQNTMQNILECGECEIDLKLYPLISNKIIVENVLITEVRSGTIRETDGGLKEKKKKSGTKKDDGSESKQKKQKDKKEKSSFKKDLNIDSLLAGLELQSLTKMEALNNEMSEQYKKWEIQIQNLEIEKDAAKIGADLEKIDVKNIKSLDGLNKASKDAKNVKSLIDDVNKKLSQSKKELRTDLNKMNSDIKNVDDWIKEDYSNAMSMADLPDFSLQNVGKMIFGDKLVSQLYQYLNYLSMARKYQAQFKSDKPEKEEPPRYKGQDIYFSEFGGLPDFWIKNIELSGQTPDGLSLSGKISDIVSNQKLIQKETLVNISGNDAGKVSYDLNAKFNYLEDIDQEFLNLNYNGFSLANMKLSDSDMMPNSIKTGKGNFKVDLQLSGEEINGKIKMTGAGLVFEKTETQQKQTEMNRLIQEVVSGVDYIEVLLRSAGNQIILSIILIQIWIIF